MTKKHYQIPFYKNGDLYDYDPGKHNPDVVWIDNYIFCDELEYIGYSQRRGSTKIRLKSVTDNRNYKMTIGDFDDCIMAGHFLNKTMKLEFTFGKRGSTFILRPVLQPKP